LTSDADPGAIVAALDDAVDAFEEEGHGTPVFERGQPVRKLLRRTETNRSAVRGDDRSRNGGSYVRCRSDSRGQSLSLLSPKRHEPRRSRPGSADDLTRVMSSIYRGRGRISCT
jgi:hypothetical protein